MKFPYGISDYYQLISEDYFYVDRTGHIRLIEAVGKQLLFLRPCRFGKSLLLSTLENYYDLAKADEFERLFGPLAIGQNPTPRHNQYFVLKWDFSAVDPQGEPQEIKRALHNHFNNRIKFFATYYQNFLPQPVEIDPLDAFSSFESVLIAIQQSPHQLYLFIDEYDNFANEVFMVGQQTSQERYKALLYGEGTLKALFKVVKSASAGLGLDRVFITGVSPVVLSDMTSGYNVAKNVHLRPEFNDLCGFREEEVEATLKEIAIERDLPPLKAMEALSLMQTFYNGYAFSYEASPFVYNPTLALYFMEHFQEAGQYPREILDSNLAMDREKISYISRLPGGEEVVLNALTEEYPLNIQGLAHRFGVEDMLSATKDTTFMASLLYYFGVLTIGDKTPFGEFTLKIPNLAVQRLYVEQIQTLLLPDFRDIDAGKRAAQRLYQTGDMQALCDFVEQRYFKVSDNRDYRWANELTLKTAFLTLLFNDLFYIMASETRLERSYADLTMIVRPEMRQYRLLDILIEFKYVSLSEAGLTSEEAQALSLEAVNRLTPIQQKLAEARTKVQAYRRKLVESYGDLLRLRTYAVVALGFERLAWEEVIPPKSLKP